MNFRWIKYFLAVASTLSFSRAAENLHISQSTLSQQIQQLEEYYGVKLFNRLGRSITLTAAGIELQDAASRLLVEEEQLQERLQTIERGESIETYPLRIFFDSHMAFGSHLITGVISSILKLQNELKDRILFHPRFTAADLDDPAVDLNTILSDPQIDVWLLGSESNMKHSFIQFETLFEDEFALLISKNHPLYREDLSLKDVPHILNNTILFMIQNRSKHFRSVLDHTPGCENLDPSIRFEKSAEVISVYVSLGVGVSIVPQDNQNMNLSQDYKAIPIPNTKFYTLLGCRPNETNPLVPMIMKELRTNVAPLHMGLGQYKN